MDIFILRGGEQTGPFDEQAVQKLIKTGAVRPQDMAWRKGLPAWLPVSEVLNPGSEKPSEPPPVVQVSGVRSAPQSVTPATAKQKALLKYLGVEFSEKASKSEAALLVSDALEAPKLQARLAKWNEEKTRLHSDVFADEIDHRKAGRGATYVELCQTQGVGVVKDVTKAHCQVLVESLDKRFPSWEASPKDALWHYFFPAIAEHFPMLVMDEWKSKLRFGSTPKGATSSAHISGAISTSPERGPSPAQAAARGVVYGLAALGLIIGAMQLMKPSDPTLANQGAAATPPPTPPPTPEAPVQKPPTDAPLIAAIDPVPALPLEPTPPAPVEAPPVAPVVPAAPPMAEQPAAPPVVPTIPPVNPVPAGPPTLPRADTVAPPIAPPPMTTPTVPVAPVAPVAKTDLTLTKPVSVQLQFGKVVLPAGTKVKFLGAIPTGLKCNFNNSIIVVPVTSTDYDGPQLPAAPATLPPGIPAPAPGTPPKPVTPTDL